MNVAAAQQAALRRIGFDVELGFQALTVDEDDPRWSALRAFVDTNGGVDIPMSTYSEAELESARWLEMLPSWLWGYPQPEEQFGYRAATYDIATVCSDCGWSGVPVAPFLLKREPKWGRRCILQLNWVFDEYFCTPQLWEEVFSDLEIGRQPVQRASDRKPLATVVRLESHTSDAPLDPRDLAGMESSACRLCRRSRYSPIQSGFFPRFLGEPQCDLVRTREVFGSGGSSHSAVVVSAKLFGRLRNKKARGVVFRPVRAESGGGSRE